MPDIHMHLDVASEHALQPADDALRFAPEAIELGVPLVQMPLDHLLDRPRRILDRLLDLGLVQGFAARFEEFLRIDLDDDFHGFPQRLIQRIDLCGVLTAWPGWLAWRCCALRKRLRFRSLELLHSRAPA